MTKNKATYWDIIFKMLVKYPKTASYNDAAVACVTIIVILAHR